jgi:hypothetical protein
MLCVLRYALCGLLFAGLTFLGMTPVLSKNMQNVKCSFDPKLFEMISLGILYFKTPYPRFGAKTIQRQCFLNNLITYPSILL